MEVLGIGFVGVVVAVDDDFVDKFYGRRSDWEREHDHLNFLNDIAQQGFDVGCRIPKVTSSDSGKSWKVNGKTYRYRSRMERVPGVTADAGCDSSNVASVGKNLGTVLFALHTKFQKFIPRWTRDFDKSDKLFTHIVHEKADKVLNQETDQTVKRFVTEAVTFLQPRKQSLKADYTLSHYDLNLNNILIDPQTGTVNGLVDWPGLGPTHPSLSLYQLPERQDIWQYAWARYLKLGGSIAEDILYAAAVIHWAWAPWGLREVGWKFDESEMEKNLRKSVQLFEKHT